ncbi:hypothetical protein [Aulosira sp. FACHB-615]|uniref:hypothetical protein n=1 Tax=Aulosira sp. FACHB-615 TaxID=2692777 RepID=UPI0016844AE7|nr:hypothetical protein [Aulosira sp. FACHB-615]MBD2492484.1 hypothetical protein [Aulosira sp. FACHB-615]
MLVSSPYLPTTAKSDRLALNTQIKFDTNYYAPLVVVDFGGGEAYTATNTGDVSLPDNWESVMAVEINGQTLTPAVDPENPQTNEFLYNPYTKTVQVSQSGGSIKVLGGREQLKFAPPLLLPPHPDLFTKLPLTGAIALNESFEQHPTAQFEFEVTGVSKSTLQNIFKPGTEIDLYGIPLRINSLNLTELPRAIYPDSRIKVSASLGGRWENYLDTLCFLRSDGKNNAPSDTPFQDPECVSTNTVNVDPNSNTTIALLLAKLGINYIGPNLAPVPIPDDTPRDAVVSPIQLLSDRLRLANSFVRYSNAQGIQVVPVNSTRVWTYQESDILGEVETSYEAIAKTSKSRLTSIADYNPSVDLVNFPSTITAAPVPTLRGEGATALGFEYPNIEITGDFTETTTKEQERTQGQTPRYVRKEIKRNTRAEGDVTANIPLEGVSEIKTMSLCFDIGGQTKSRSYVTEENGTKVQVVDETWGFAYTAASIYNGATGNLSGDPNTIWRCIRRTTTDYYYDYNTGYLLYVITSGYNTVRYKEENPQAPETLELTPSDDEYSLYSFFRVPVTGRTSYSLKLFPEYVASEGLFELVKTCNRDGTSSLTPLINPDYAPPYYVEWERTEMTAFASRKNIDDGQPDFIVGEESRFQMYRQIIPAEYKEKTVGFENGYPIIERGDLITDQKILAHNIEFKAQGQAIAQAVERVWTEESMGELTLATRRNPLYTRQEPAQDTKRTDINDQQQYRYLVQSAGYAVSDPVGGSESVPLAKTWNEALVYLQCKLAIENWRNGFTESLQIPGNLQIRSGDRFNYWCNGEYRQRVVLSVQTQLNILGVVDGVPRITYATSLSLGPWVNPTVAYSKIPLPKEPKAPTVNITVTNVVSQTLGSVLDWATIRSRRNF